MRPDKSLTSLAAVALALDDFWGTPEGRSLGAGDVGGHVGVVVHAGGTHICELGDAFTSDEHISALDVTVDDAAAINQGHKSCSHIPGRDTYHVQLSRLLRLGGANQGVGGPGGANQGEGGPGGANQGAVSHP